MPRARRSPEASSAPSARRGVIVEVVTAARAEIARQVRNSHTFKRRMKPPDRSGGFLFAGAVRPDCSANDARVLPGPGGQISKQLATVIDVAV